MRTRIAVSVLAITITAAFFLTFSSAGGATFGLSKIGQGLTMLGAPIWSMPVVFMTFGLDRYTFTGLAMVVCGVAAIALAWRSGELANVALPAAILFFSALACAATVGARGYLGNWHLQYALPGICAIYAICYRLTHREGRFLLCGTMLCVLSLSLFGYHAAFTTHGPNYLTYIRSIEDYARRVTTEPDLPKPFPLTGGWDFDPEMAAFLRARRHASLVAVRAAERPEEAGAAPRSEPRAVVSLRVSPNLWMPAERRAELLELLRQRRDTIEEVSLFTSFTHAVLPWETLEQRAELLKAVIPEFKKLGLRTGINHLCTIGHLDENLEHSLAEPWQKITAVDGTAARGCYCPLDPRFQAFTRRCYQALAEAKPDFIWIDDDVRMGYHPPAVSSCFCDLCLARFGEETGETWTRERAARVIWGKGSESSREVRVQWAAHNRRIINEVFTLIRGAVDTVDPNLVLGSMPTDQLYETMDYPGWSRILAGPRQLPVKWRPGGGFYTDDRPLDALRKAHQMGRTAAAIPVGDTDIQQEHENFPYQKLKKSETVFMAETAMAMGAGCTGVALNVMGISPHPFDEYLPYFDRMREARPFLDRMAAAVGRRPAEGIWPAFTAEKTWAAGDADTLSCLTELAEIGLPPAYGQGGATVHLLSGDAVHAFSRADLEAMFATAVLLDGPALQQLQALGLGDLVGFEIAGHRDRDTIERFTADPLNGSHAEWWRDCRPSFTSTRAFLLRATSPRSRSLAELIDFQEHSAGPVMGVSENRLGGRVAVLGYYPWTSLQNLSKSTQLKRVIRWLSKDTLPGYVDSFHKLALWIRHTEDGRPTVVLVNISADAVENASLLLRTDAAGVTLTDMRCRDTAIPAAGRDGDYARFALPRLSPWEAILVIGDKAD